VLANLLSCPRNSMCFVAIKWAGTSLAAAGSVASGLEMLAGGVWVDYINLVDLTPGMPSTTFHQFRLFLFWALQGFFQLELMPEAVRTGAFVFNRRNRGRCS
jgi:hypothetical protein